MKTPALDGLYAARGSPAPRAALHRSYSPRVRGGQYLPASISGRSSCWFSPAPICLRAAKISQTGYRYHSGWLATTMPKPAATPRRLFWEGGGTSAPFEPGID